MIDKPVSKEARKRATYNSLRHWRHNVKTFPYEGTPGEKRVWFNKCCKASRCALCKLLSGHNCCKGCPLKDANHRSCCTEWHIANDQAILGILTIQHIEAVVRRLEKEYKKLCGKE